jgi:hypothetical protein
MTLSDIVRANLLWCTTRLLLERCGSVRPSFEWERMRRREFISLLGGAPVAALGAQLRMLKAQILEFDRRIMAWHRSNATSKRLDAIPGSGRRWPPRWLPPWLIQAPSGRPETSQPGLGSYKSSARGVLRAGRRKNFNQDS